MKRAHLEGYHSGHHITGQRRARTNPRSGSKEQTAAHATHSGPTIQPGRGFGSVTPVMALELSHVQRGPPRLSVIILSLQIHPIKHSIHRRTLIDRHNHLRVSDTRCCSLLFNDRSWVPPIAACAATPAPSPDRGAATGVVSRSVPVSAITLHRPVQSDVSLSQPVV